MLDETIIGDRYRLLHKLGAGGMGEVHEAEHTVTGRRVALKLLLADNYYDKKAATWTERFRREARAASSVETPHAVQVLDAGQDERTRRPFIAMELLKGRDLGVVLRGGPLPPLVAARVIGQACLGLRTAHDRGVLHRDLKPSNLFVVEDAEGKATVKLVDFGIAKITTDQKLTTLTRTGQLVGTPVYLSPEQARGVPGIDARADVFSLGAVLYKALCGATPHRLDTSLVDFILRLCTEPAPPLSARAPWVPPEVAAIAHRALRLEPDDRFQSAGEFIDALSAVAGDFELRSAHLVPVVDRSLVEETDAETIPLDAKPLEVRASEGKASDAKPRARTALLAVSFLLIAVAVIVAVVVQKRSEPETFAAAPDELQSTPADVTASAAVTPPSRKASAPPAPSQAEAKVGSTVPAAPVRSRRRSPATSSKQNAPPTPSAETQPTPSAAAPPKLVVEEKFE